eukprot:1191813-Pleurochrysis_carterae.AAC.2
MPVMKSAGFQRAGVKASVCCLNECAGIQAQLMQNTLARRAPVYVLRVRKCSSKRVKCKFRPQYASSLARRDRATGPCFVNCASSTHDEAHMCASSPEHSAYSGQFRTSASAVTSSARGKAGRFQPNFNCSSRSGAYRMFIKHGEPRQQRLHGEDASLPDRGIHQSTQGMNGWITNE